MASQSPGVFRQYRWKELGLFIIPFLIFLVEMVQLFLATQDTQSSLSVNNLPTIQGLIPVFGLIGVLLAANILFSIFFRKADQVLFPLVGLLSGLGVLMATRLGPDIKIDSLGTQQLVWVMLGIAICCGVMFLMRDTLWLARYKYTWAVVSFLVLLPSVISGLLSIRSGAPTRDILNFGPLHIQPSELLKISIVIFFAGYLNETRDVLTEAHLRIGILKLPPLRQLGPLVLMLTLSLIIFLVVRELGLAMLIYGLFLSMTYLANGKLTYVVASLAVFVLLGFVGYGLFSYVRGRFATVSIDVLHWTQASDELYQNSALQVVQGLIAVASGGILGSGLGLGAPSYVPVVESDMVFTAFCEELGLAGVFAVIGIYLFIIYRGYRIAIEATEPFNQLLAAGLTTIFAIQTLIISAGNLKLMPLTGIPLPFLSYGGSSILANYIIIGVLLRISYNSRVAREGLS
ncbi:MAG: FtsW/RodA/SpoVE family cell cycle protein [Chloroflexi bacterium]|nr:MAG: FtsW/RodA/SpoVE family cell cycle protein [Chloroflexota bacterium]